MLPVAISLGTIGFILIIASVLILAIILCFYILNRNSSDEWTIHQYWPIEEKPPTILESLKDLFRFRKKTVSEAEIQHHFNEVYSFSPSIEHTASNKKKSKPTEDIHALKNTIAQQQKQLNTLLKNVGNVRQEESRQAVTVQKELQKRIEQLEHLLEEKEQEVQNVKQYEAIVRKMNTRLENIYIEFDDFQEKIASLEKEASRATTLMLDLEDVKEMHEQARREVTRKQEKLEEAFAENQRLQEELAETEDKLQEANLQRQQLIKKVRFLEEVNAELQSITEANKKLQTELRRLSELESRLSIITEERNHLLHRHTED